MFIVIVLFVIIMKTFLLITDRGAEWLFRAIARLRKYLIFN